MIFLLMGLLSLATSPLAALPIITIALLLLPPVRSLVYSKTKFHLSAKARAASIFVLFLVFGGFVQHEQKLEEEAKTAQLAQEKAEKEAKIRQENIDYFNTNSADILAAAKAALNNKDYHSVLSQTNKYLATQNKELNEIHSAAQKGLKDAEVLDKTNKLLTELKVIPASDFDKNMELYQQLSRLHPENEKYKAKIVTYQSKKEKAEQDRVVAEVRKERIERQFSAWDGSHRNLEKTIKKSMNDPDSYDHAETIYWDNGDHLIVKTTFRGKNAFGGVVKNFVKAKVSLDGNILQILDQT